MENEYKRLITEVKSYIADRQDLLKIEILEKSSKIITLLIAIITCIVLSVILLIYASILTYLWINSVINDPYISLAMIMGFHLIILIIIAIFHKQIFLNFIIRKIKSIFF